MQRVHTFHLVHDLRDVRLYMHLCIRKSSLYQVGLGQSLKNMMQSEFQDRLGNQKMTILYL